MGSESESSIADLDDQITSLQNSLSLSPQSHSEYISCVEELAWLRRERYQLSDEKEDLDKSIEYCTKAILLPPISRNGPHIIRLLFHIALALLECADTFEQPEGLKYSIKYFRYLQIFPFDSFDIPRTLVTESLIRALGAQVEWNDDSEDGVRDIKEMVVLCNTLLVSNDFSPFPTSSFLSLRGAADAQFYRGIQIELLDEVIGCLRDAIKACSLWSHGSHPIMYALAEQLRARFIKAHSLDDYDEAEALLDKILDPSQLGGCPDSIQSASSILATYLALARYNRFSSPEYAEVAIFRLRASLSSPSIDEERRFEFTELLSMLAGDRYDEYSLSESLEEANSSISQLVGLSSSKSTSLMDDVRKAYSETAIQQKIDNLEELLSNAPPGTERHEQCLSDLEDWYISKYHHTKDIKDIKECIKYTRLSVNATQAIDPLRISPFLSLRNILFFAFKETREIRYLNESIAVDYDILEMKTTPFAHWQKLHFFISQELVRSLCAREKLLGQKEDRHEAIRLISVSINYEHAPEPDRFRLSCQWAILARSVGHATTSSAYRSAMSLMQKSLSFAPTVSVQHTRLVAMGAECQTMPLDYASYQISLDQFEEALETLEQGRALLWSEMRGLRTLVTQLVENSPLAKRFAKINQELEVLTTSVAPSGKPEIGDGVSQDGSDPFGRLVIKWKKLVEERDALISQVQNQPGLEGFMKAPSFTALRSAASRGPIILVNHCKWRSDIMIIFQSSPPCSIPTAADFFDRANKLRDELVQARKKGLDSCEYQNALRSVLKGLYELVGEPVIRSLRLLGVPEQSRIWWCPTSVFCSLPLHAMGPIPSSKVRKQYFSDLYIPSYTPSFSALIESHKASPHTSEKPSLLLVAQPEDDLPGVTKEIEVLLERALKARIKVTGLVSSEATPSSVLEGLRGSRLAHFACHGVLVGGKPFEASFKLHVGSRLTLLDIIRSRLPDAEFAFLSCCHTAEITKQSIADEALHLTAAMQYCGFRSVVGTMWEMADTDGTDLAKNFYKSLFSRKESGVPYYERSAGALRDATQKLREKRGVNLERWVNFVHYGA